MADPPPRRDRPPPSTSASGSSTLATRGKSSSRGPLHHHSSQSQSRSSPMEPSAQSEFQGSSTAVQRPSREASAVARRGRMPSHLMVHHSSRSAPTSFTSESGTTESSATGPSSPIFYSESPNDLSPPQPLGEDSCPAPTSLQPAAVPMVSSPMTNRDDLHPKWYIRAVIYMTAYLHTKHRVTFAAAGLILVCLAFIFSVLAGDLIGAVKMPITLKSVFSKLDIKDNFVVHPTCFSCHTLFEPDISPDTFCPHCEEEIFGAPPEDNAVEDDDVEAGHTNPSGAPSSRKNKRKPYMVTPIQVLSVGLKDFFKRPGMVAAVNSWRAKPRNKEDMTCMQDGKVWNTIKDQDGSLFFFGQKALEEIRLGVSFSLDWYS
ncbi:hypothetical protein K438DRAFT_1716353, partial [Mycena galopus ATCC 62051]